MSNPRDYWQGSTLLVEWTISDPEGQPVTDATVTGTVTLPDGTAAPMSVQTDGNVYRASYVASQPGRHAWELTATGTAVDTRQGAFVVRRDLVGLPPITVDPSTPIGQVRLLATDLDEAEPLFDDEQIGAFLTMEGGNVRLAAALALETIARSEVLVSKKIRTLDLQTDGPAVARELRESAAALREQAAASDTATAFDVVDFNPSSWYGGL